NQRTTAELLDNTDQVLLIQCVSGDNRNLALLHPALLLNRFYNINRKYSLTGSFVSDYKNISCSGSSIPLSAVSILFENIDKLLTHSTDRYKIGEQFFLLLCQTKLQTDFTCCAQVISSLNNKSCIKGRSAGRSGVFVFIRFLDFQNLFFFRLLFRRFLFLFFLI